MRRVAEALLLALLLIAVQTAILTHEHGDGQAPAGAALQSCEFCTGHQGALPAPDPAEASKHAAPPLLIAETKAGPPRAIRLAAAHRSRAPPASRSI
jgi:hypothetical protein